MASSNFHSHCTFCDGKSIPEDFVRSAISSGLRAYGFSSHSPLPFETGWNMTKDSMPAYIAEINRLKSKYAGQIELYLGLEIDYLDDACNAAMPSFQSLPLDYRISSIHFLPWQQPLLEENCVCIDGPYTDFEAGVRLHFGGDIRRAAGKYFDNAMQMVETGGFDVVGHIDKIYMNGSKHAGFDRSAGWYGTPFLELLDLIAEKQLIVEINTKNYRSKNETYPHTDTYKELKKRNIPVMINSDCHYPDHVNSGCMDIVASVKAAGYGSTRELVAGKWQDMPL